MYAPARLEKRSFFGSDLLQWLLFLPWALPAADSHLILSGPPGLVPAGERVPIWVYVLNHSPSELRQSFPGRLSCQIMAGAETVESSLELRSPGEAGEVGIPPGGFRGREYLVRIPPSFTNRVFITLSHSPTSSAVVQMGPAGSVFVAQEQARGSHVERLLQGAEPYRPAFTANEFFKQHISGYEPFYFLAGNESPNAKFQVSFKYQLVNSASPLAHHVPPLKGFHFGYTQTSLWDWNEPSAPFFDSSYKPELLYLWERAGKKHWAAWFRLDLQGGMQHESNGQEDLDSRSLNIVYFRPTVTFGRVGDFQFSLSPRAWFYVGDLEDNRDLKDYRGYADLRTIVGWERGLQLSTIGRLGDDGDRTSVQCDLTYPMMRLLSGSFSVYLHAQYFNGYGESLLLYNERGTSFRIGFSLFR